MTNYENFHVDVNFSKQWIFIFILFEIKRMWWKICFDVKFVVFQNVCIKRRLLNLRNFDFFSIDQKILKFKIVDVIASKLEKKNFRNHFVNQMRSSIEKK